MTEPRNDFLNQFEEEFRKAKEKQDKKISDISNWVDIYEGKPYGNEKKGKSQMVWKLVKKQGEALISNIIKPFLGSGNIVEMEPLTKNDYYKAKVYEKLINHFWLKDFDNNKFMKTLGRVNVKEGTVFVRVGWEKIDKSKTIVVDKMDEATMQKLQAKNLDVEPTEDGKFKITKTDIVKNRPTAKVIRNENVYTDPTADNFEESNFIIYEYTTSLSQLKSQPMLYDKESLSVFENTLGSGNDIPDHSQIHNYNDEQLTFQDKAREKIVVYEYFGKYDIDGDGIVEDVVAVVAKSAAKKENGDDNRKFILKLKKSPFPFKGAPFICINFMEEEFDIWGRGLADIIGDEQRLMTAFIRGILDNAASSNNGQKFIKKKALDPLNYQRLINGEEVIEVNANENIGAIIKDGSYNELPSSVYNMLQIIESNAESLTGISKMMQGIPGTEMKSAATNFSTMMSQSQVRLLDITNNISSGLRKMFLMWLAMCMEYLTDEEIDKITGINIPELKVKETQKLIAEFGLEELPEDTQQKAIALVVSEVDDMFNRKDIKTDIKVKVGTDGLKQIKIQSINMLMQQAAPLVQAGAAPAEGLQLLLAEMADLLEFPKVSDKIRTYQPQPSQEEIAMQQVKIQQEQAKAEKEAALAKNAHARTTETMVKAKAIEANIDPDVANKYMDAALKAKGESDGRKDGDRAEKEGGKGK